VVLRPIGGANETANEAMDAVAGQVAMACSLALLRERAASRARLEATEQLLWDLLQGRSSTGSAPAPAPSSWA
jgi:hypothetical protein